MDGAFPIERAMRAAGKAACNSRAHTVPATTCSLVAPRPLMVTSHAPLARRERSPPWRVTIAPMRSGSSGATASITLTNRCSPPESPTDGGGFRWGTPPADVPEGVEFAKECRPVGRAGPPVLRERPRHQVVERRRELGPELSHARRLFPEHLRQHRHDVGARERGLPRQALEEDAAEREDVAAGVEGGVRHRLLRAHVPHRADDHAGTGHRACGRSMTRQLKPHDAEIEELRACGVGPDEEHIARLDVPVNDAQRVRGREALGHPARNGEALGHAQACPLEPRVEVLSVEPFHREEGRSGRRGPVRHVPDDGGVTQIRKDPRLLREAFVVAAAARHDLERHRAFRPAIEGPIDRAHAPAPREALDDEAVRHDLAFRQARRDRVHREIVDGGRFAEEGVGGIDVRIVRGRKRGGLVGHGGSSLGSLDVLRHSVSATGRSNVPGFARHAEAARVPRRLVRSFRRALSATGPPSFQAALPHASRVLE